MPDFGHLSKSLQNSIRTNALQAHFLKIGLKSVFCKTDGDKIRSFPVQENKSLP